MTRTTAWLAAFAALLGLTLTACEDSQHPATDPEKAKPDAALAGVWIDESEDDQTAYYHIGAAGGKLPRGVMRVQVVVHKEDGELETPEGVWLAVPATLGKRQVLSLGMVPVEDFTKMQEKGWKQATPKTYLLFEYAIDGEKMTVRGVNPDAKRKAVESGRLEGEKKQHWVMLTASTEKLAEFLASPEADDFFAEDAGTLTRVKRPK